MNPLRIGSRGSKLALWQSNHIKEILARDCGAPSEIVVIKTSGDQLASAPLSEIGGKGIFVKEIEEALLSGKIDLAVHSAKDLPTQTPAGLGFPAICEREDVRDALVSAKGEKLNALPRRARIGTGSLRRQAQLRYARRDFQFVDMRGNVDTRLLKLGDGACDAIVLAKAGLDRLGLTSRITEVLSTEVSLPAVGQGALAIEARDGDAELLAILKKLDHAATRAAVMAERSLLRELEGGCQIPMGAWARIENGALVLDACVVSLDGADYIRRRVVGKIEGAEEVGRRMAHEMIDAGGARILLQDGRHIDGR
jgi:hydroxymethylbilane synthase